MRTPTEDADAFEEDRNGLRNLHAAATNVIAQLLRILRSQPSNSPPQVMNPRAPMNGNEMVVQT